MRALILVGALLIVGCGPHGEEQSVEPSTQDTAAPPQPASQPAVEFKASRLKSALPEGTELPFQYHRLNDSFKKAESGRNNLERRVFVEIRGIAPEQAEALMLSLLQQKGFQAPVQRSVKGANESTFKREDGAELIMKVSTKLKKRVAPDATGTMHLTWRPPSDMATVD